MCARHSTSPSEGWCCFGCGVSEICLFLLITGHRLLLLCFNKHGIAYYSFCVKHGRKEEDRRAGGRISTTVAKALSCGTEMFIRRRILEAAHSSQAVGRLSASLLSEVFGMKLLSLDSFASKFERAGRERDVGYVTTLKEFSN